MIKGEVRNLANYGAFVEIEPGIDGLLHISDISWTKKITHPNEVYAKKGEEVECVVLEVDQGQAAHQPGRQAARRGPVGPRHPRSTTSRAWSSAARSRRSPTSASSSSSRTIWRVCCTSPSWPTTRSRTRRTWFEPGEEIDVKILRVDTVGSQDRTLAQARPVGRFVHGRRRQVLRADGRPSEPRQRGGMDDHDALGTDKISVLIRVECGSCEYNKSPDGRRPGAPCLSARLPDKEGWSGVPRDPDGYPDRRIVCARFPPGRQSDPSRHALGLVGPGNRPCARRMEPCV